MGIDTVLKSVPQEFEVLAFYLSGNLYGIPTEKVKEILMSQETTTMPNTHPSIAGIFMPRDTLLIAIDLNNYLGYETAKEQGYFITTNQTKIHAAFFVEKLHGIIRVSEEDIRRPDATMPAAESNVAIGTIEINGKPVTILDFEKILSDIVPQDEVGQSDTDALRKNSRSTVSILIVQESNLLNKLLVDALKKAGYDNLILTENGAEAHNIILQCLDNGTMKERVQCIITDIKMPEIDGHRLVKLVKSNEKTSHIPIIIFSSIINYETRMIGERIGANAQLSKAEIGQLVKTIDDLVVLTDTEA